MVVSQAIQFIFIYTNKPTIWGVPYFKKDPNEY